MFPACDLRLVYAVGRAVDPDHKFPLPADPQC
jgi:hypothetical protein